MEFRWYYYPHEMPLPGRYCVSAIDQARKELIFVGRFDGSDWFDTATNMKLDFTKYLVAFRPIIKKEKR